MFFNVMFVNLWGFWAGIKFKFLYQPSYTPAGMTIQHITVTNVSTIYPCQGNLTAVKAGIKLLGSMWDFFNYDKILSKTKQ